MMIKRAISLTVGLVVGLSLSEAAFAQEAISEQEAHNIGVDAYVYFYPLLSMDVTRKQFTNVEPGKEFGKGPMNMFVNVPEYPPPISKASCVRISIRSTPLRGWI